MDHYRRETSGKIGDPRNDPLSIIQQRSAGAASSTVESPSCRNPEARFKEKVAVSGPSRVRVGEEDS